MKNRFVRKLELIFRKKQPVGRKFIATEHQIEPNVTIKRLFGYFNHSLEIKKST